jgi:LAO/AO transport system kinase
MDPGQRGKTMKEKSYKSALQVNNGVQAPPVINEELVKRHRQQRRKPLCAEDYMQGILSGNRTILSQAITLIESSLPLHAQLAQEIIERCIPIARRSLRIGITGVPGVGKSSFIEALGMHLIQNKHKLAVLAIDPSSKRTKGSIMGDKTRMEHLSSEPHAFIRPSPSAGSLGGVARKTRETIILCEAAGFDTIFIETVGVGQSEIAVHSMVDFFLLLMLAGAGDELQGIKRGIMEMADAIAITKADGENISKAERARAEFTNALHLFPPTGSGWSPPVVTCSSKTHTGISGVWDMICMYTHLTHENGYFDKRRLDQLRYWMHETIDEQLKAGFYHNHGIQQKLAAFEKKVLKGEISPFTPARILLNEYWSYKQFPKQID